MNSFAVLDGPETDEGIRLSRQRRKSKGKTPSEEDITVPDVQRPKSSRKKKEKGGQPPVKQEANVQASAQDAGLPSTSKSELAPDFVTDQEEQRRWGLVGQVCHWIDVKIFQYNVTFGLYMLDRWERWLFNICAFSLIFAVGYSSYTIARPYTAPLQILLESLVKQDEASE